MTFTHALSTNNYGCSKFIVDASAANGTHTTIAAALTAASSGDTIFIRPGTYTENLTHKAGVNLTCLPGDGYAPNVIINGNVTCSGAGTFQISGVQLRTNSANCLTVSGSSATIVQLNDVYINCLNNTGISYTTSNSSSTIAGFNCSFSLGTTGIAYYSMSSTGAMNFYRSDFENTGASTTASSNSAGTVAFWNCVLAGALSTSSNGTVGGDNCSFNLAGINTTAITTAGSSASNFLYNCFVNSGSASAISIGTGTTLTAENNVVSSSNTNAITGAGTIIFSGLNFNNSKVINTTTKSPQSLRPGLLLDSTGSSGTTGQVPVATTASEFTWGASSGTGSLVLLNTQNASASSSISFSSTYITSTYNTYLIVFQNVVQSTNSNTELQFSTNDGSTYLTTGYVGNLWAVPINSAAWGQLNSTTFLYITVNTTSIGSSGYIYLFNPLNGKSPQICSMNFSNNSGNSVNFTLDSGYQTTTNINNIKFFDSSGTITTGTFSLYGVIQ